MYFCRLISAVFMPLPGLYHARSLCHYRKTSIKTIRRGITPRLHLRQQGVFPPCFHRGSSAQCVWSKCGGRVRCVGVLVRPLPSRVAVLSSSVLRCPTVCREIIVFGKEVLGHASYLAHQSSQFLHHNEIFKNAMEIE